MIRSALCLAMVLSLPLYARTNDVATPDDESPVEYKDNPYEPQEYGRTKPDPFYNESKECGESNNQIFKSQRKNGITVCGRAVRYMVSCMAKSFGISGCDANCGAGKSWVSCDKLKSCGYKKFNGDAPECWKPGVVRAYNKTYTTNGKVLGHVEFGCGDKFCSIYKQPLAKPWPTFRDKTKPDACWYPDAAKTGMSRGVASSKARSK